MILILDRGVCNFLSIARMITMLVENVILDIHRQTLVKQKKLLTLYKDLLK